ncbi:MAG: prepilin peptidase, partial [Deltaproteobacteria bacterium]|nr:prepilin peptidase [Kofleriaceae bacterium]
MATPAAVEPRTACPACGGQIHPIAGRCKHCKADLTRLRNGAAPAARPNLVALGGGNGRAVRAVAVTS